MNRIRIPGDLYSPLKNHLLSGDGKESVAIALCGRSLSGDSHTLLVREILFVPNEVCFRRTPEEVIWPTEVINPLLERAAAEGSALIKLHSHPTGFPRFSTADDQSDHLLFKSIFAWMESDLPHASCVMLPDGRLFGRFFGPELTPRPLHQVSVAGSNILNWFYSLDRPYYEDLQTRNLQAFGKKTIQLISNLKFGVVGCSGTGSIVIEQLKRLGAGILVLVDPDHVDFLNLNRIVSSTKKDAANKELKTAVMKRSIEETGFGTEVRTFPENMASRQIIKELADCDVLFSCVDSAEGRHLLNLVSSFYNVPLFDMGVHMKSGPGGTIENIYGSVHYIQPGGSSLLSRGQYDMERVRSESIRRTNEEEAQKNQYLAEVGESSPAVISTNMQVAATAVNDFLARLHPYRTVPNEDVDAIRIQFGDALSYPEKLNVPCPFFTKFTGWGDRDPLLNNPELSHG
jgi:hypothetical protein